MKAAATALLVVVAVGACLSDQMAAENAPASPFSPDLFRLTLQQDENSNLPLSPSCSDEARLTLACRAFVLELENLSEHTLELIEPSCSGPTVKIEERSVAQTGSEDWAELTETKHKVCKSLAWNHIRVRPGKALRYRTRTISENRSFELEGWFPFVHTPGTHTVRAQWLLQGCALQPDASDCTPEAAAQVTATSNEITIDSPPLDRLGNPQLSFEVTISQNPLTPTQQERCAQSNASIDSHSSTIVSGISGDAH